MANEGSALPNIPPAPSSAGPVVPTTTQPVQSPAPFSPQFASQLATGTIPGPGQIFSPNDAGMIAARYIVTH